MLKNIAILGAAGAAVCLLGGCNQVSSSAGPSGTQIVLAGESFATGAEAVKEANNAIANAAASGCKAISVGGYGAGASGKSEVGGGLVIGVPVLVDCPQGTKLLPNGAKAP